MIKAVLYEVGTKLRTPSGGLAVLVRWKVKLINPKNRDEGVERVATLKLLYSQGGAYEVDFAESFVRLCQVIA